jgi:hypothetical protein
MSLSIAMIDADCSDQIKSPAGQLAVLTLTE